MSKKSGCRNNRHPNENGWCHQMRCGHGGDDNCGNGYCGSRCCRHLQNWEPFPSRVLSRPITFTNYHVHRHHKKNVVSQVSNFDRLKAVQPTGLVFVWPKRRKFYYRRELSIVLWSISHTLYWLHVIHLFPNGAGLSLGQPPWNYKSPLPKPQVRDYIIEPDWNSAYD